MFQRLLLVFGLLISFASTAAAHDLQSSRVATTSLCSPYTVGTQIGSGSIPVTSASGALVSGLVVGRVYAIEVTGGPWYASPNIATAHYGAWVSNDSTTWYRLNAGATDGYDFTNYWGTAAEAVGTVYRRGYWQATTSSIRIRVGDNRFDDNSGSLSWRLYETIPSSGFVLGSQIRSGSIPVTSPSGALVSGLTIGQTYAIEVTGGPWYASPNIATAHYGAWVSNDSTTWYRLNAGAADGYDFTNYWGTAAEAVSTVYRRGYWQATTSSVRIRVGDNRFDDNSGSLSWRLYTASRCN